MSGETLPRMLRRIGWFNSADDVQGGLKEPSAVLLMLAMKVRCERAYLEGSTRRPGENCEQVELWVVAAEEILQKFGPMPTPTTEGEES